MPRSPEEEEIRVVLDHGVGVTREVAQAGEVESGARGHLEHAAPRLVAQHLDLGRVEEPRVAGLVLPRQVVVQAVHLLVQRQHLGVHDDLGQLGAAALAQGSPLGGQLTAAGGPEPAGQAERREQQRAQHACGGSGRPARPGSALRPGRTSLGAWRGLPGLAGQSGVARGRREREASASPERPPRGRQRRPAGRRRAALRAGLGAPLSQPPSLRRPALARDALKGLGAGQPPASCPAPRDGAWAAAGQGGEAAAAEVGPGPGALGSRCAPCPSPPPARPRRGVGGSAGAAREGHSLPGAAAQPSSSAPRMLWVKVFQTESLFQTRGLLTMLVVALHDSSVDEFTFSV